MEFIYIFTFGYKEQNNSFKNEVVELKSMLERLEK